MAIIDDRSPAAEPASTRVRVAIKLAERSLPGAKADTSTRALSELRRVVPGVEFSQYFADEQQLRAAAVAPFNHMSPRKLRIARPRPLWCASCRVWI